MNKEKTIKNPLPESLQEAMDWIREQLGHSCDLVIREFRISFSEANKAAIIYTDGLVNLEHVQEFIMKPLMSMEEAAAFRKRERDETELSLIRNIIEYILPAGGIVELEDRDAILNAALTGCAVLILEGCSIAIAIEMRGWEERGVTEPAAQTVVRGPREGFSENIRTNTSMIRRKIKDPKLWIETKFIGKSSQTAVAIAFMNGTARESIVDEVRSRLDAIDIDAILESSYIEELIQDGVYTPFPTVFHTERPDVVAAGLLEGRVAIIIDGTPFVLMVPAIFVELFQSPEDYYQRADISTLVRILRFISFAIALFVPSVYIAITTFHQEMMPTSMLISLASQREGVPFPAFIEAILMEVTFEILREAGVRMPRPVGQAVSIVGTLVIGQAAVEAGIVSAAMVIVVSITAISSFVLPSFNLSISVRMLRFLFMGLAASFGVFGIIVGFIALVLHLCRLNSFGIPYMTPLAPFNFADQKDTLMRFPMWAMLKRPRLLSRGNLTRQRKKASRNET
ncbi:spore germination protein [Paenibacillus sp. LHD-117]|uniref:spore germination protein n=1 Tax=Paenibacillus sp. LHD-117 TaxID=3071412 RepID=UPI0027E09364|nr:spore germination protein [Paenibacillus sp. LHD-117]MDQ6422578.1 spore germination protein [Paenibacillus sp. LHD-117]